jgi:hypothetical protein
LDQNIAREILEEHGDFDGAKHLVDVPGFSSPRVCQFLNELVRRMPASEHYLEIGTFAGLTLCSAIQNNAGKRAFACDKFRFYGKFTGFGFLAKRKLLANLQRYSAGSAHVSMMHTTSRALFQRELVQPPVGVYFYDGDHSYESTYHGVVAAATLLSPRSVLLMDDWNDPAIRDATRSGIRDAGLRIEWERELEGNQTQDGWWNGLGVFYLAKPSAQAECSPASTTTRADGQHY